VFVSEARSPSGKAKVCKTFIGGSIPPRASKFCGVQICPEQVKRMWIPAKHCYIHAHGLPCSEYCIDFGTLFQYSYPVISNVQKTKQACLCCTCCMCASSGAGS
jgi:hypothetical protein